MTTQQKQPQQQEQQAQLQKLLQECKKYRLDIADYATGDRTMIPPEREKELLQHLKKCQTCREAFLDYEEICATAVAEEHTKSPEFRKKMDALMERVKSSVPVQVKPLPDEEILDHEADIGSAAGVVWHCLAKNGKIEISELEGKVKLPVTTFNRAIGWLARENKIVQTRVKQTKYVYLNETERQIYQQRQAQI